MIIASIRLRTRLSTPVPPCNVRSSPSLRIMACTAATGARNRHAGGDFRFGMVSMNMAARNHSSRPIARELHGHNVAQKHHPKPCPDSTSKSKTVKNASKHKAMSYERMKKREAELKAEVAGMLAAAEAADAQEDEIFGKDKRGDEMPDWASDKEKRLAKIQEAMAALEVEAKLAAEEERRIEAEKQQQRNAEGRKKPGKPAAAPSDQPDPKSQRNFTDPESRIMKSKDGFVQAYNAQAAVDAGAQIIVAHELTQCGNDQGQLVPLIEAIENNLGRKPEQASADSGYCSESNLEALEAHGVDGYVAPGRAKHPTAANGKIGGPLTQRMRKKIDDGGFETPYRLRKQVVEPVFGQIKQARGFRQFLLRGVEKVRAEWAMICTAHNLLKLFTLAKAARAG